MLAVMSFNVGVILVAIVGRLLGFLIFGSRVLRKSSYELLLLINFINGIHDVSKSKMEELNLQYSFCPKLVVHCDVGWLWKVVHEG
ncbi:hypothetical protein H5410_029937 [Solanum commersonii]|uniref:Uncharacterized protein n=1 Tax=Solanum commersonii TaxID=4109 RepID=A0A9J5YFH4_SOLCO|nr:hypothetical protein H5410_029937 [Solanum commersonii]